MAALFNAPMGISYVLSPSTSHSCIYVGDTNNNAIRMLDASNGNQVSFTAGFYSIAGYADGAATSAMFNSPMGVAAVAISSPSPNVIIFVADSGNNLIRAIDLAGDSVWTVAGDSAQQAGHADGTGASAKFSVPTGVAASSSGSTVYVADRGNNRIRAVASAMTSSGVVTTLAGSASSGHADGIGSATFNSPSGVTLDAAGAVLYVADSGNNLVRTITVATGAVDTLAGGASGRADGTGTVAAFSSPLSLAIDAVSPDVLYVADAGNNLVRKVRISTRAVSTCAGGGSAGGSAAGRTDGAGTSVLFSTVAAIAFASTGGNGALYVADADSARASTSNNLIRMISSPSIDPASVTTVAGGGVQAVSFGYQDALGTAALMNCPQGLSYGPSGTFFFADAGNNRVRAVNVASGAVTTVAGSGVSGYADGSSLTAKFKFVQNGFIGGAVAADCAGSLFVADSFNSVIRVVVSGAVTTLAGTASTTGNANGVGGAATFNFPIGVAADCAGHVYVVDGENNNVRAINIATATVTTLAGDANAQQGFVDGIGAQASFYHPYGIAWDAGWLFIADYGNNAIRMIDISSATVTTLAGDPSGASGAADGFGNKSSFSNPIGVVSDKRGSVVVADTSNNLIRSITIANQRTKTLAGNLTYGLADGVGNAALFDSPVGVAMTDAGDVIVTDSFNNLLRTLHPIYV